MTTLLRPSAPQKRDCANGRSAEIHSTTVLSRPLASWLNLRTDVAQTPVSMLEDVQDFAFTPRSCSALRLTGLWQPVKGLGLFALLWQFARYADRIALKMYCLSHC